MFNHYYKFEIKNSLLVWFEQICVGWHGCFLTQPHSLQRAQTNTLTDTLDMNILTLDEHFKLMLD